MSAGFFDRLFGQRLRNISVDHCSGWVKAMTCAVGGLTEVGFTANEKHIIVLSHSGRGVISTSSFDLVARDNEIPTIKSPWLDQPGRKVRGIGPVSNEWVSLAGLWGGNLEATCSSEWVSEVDTRGRDEICLIKDISTERTYEVDRPLTEVRAFGFSHSGRFLLLATSSDLSVFSKSA